MGIFSWIIVGIIAGFLARLVVKGEGPGGILGDLIIGIIGALAGGYVWTNFFEHTGLTGINLHSILIAFVGSVVLLFILRMIHRMRGAPA